MPVDNFENLSSMELDVLQEIGNIGVGNVTTALAQMLGIRINMKVPVVELLDIGKVPDLLGGAGNPVAGVMLAIGGDIEGMIEFIMDIASAKKIAEVMLGSSADEVNAVNVSGINDFLEIEKAALQEMGNIMAGSYLNAISKMTGLAIIPSVPELAIDMAGAILSEPMIEFGKTGDKALLIEAEFGAEELFKGYFILTPTNDSYVKILNSLKL